MYVCVLCVFVRRLSPLQTRYRLRSVAYGQIEAVRNIFPAHCVGVTNIVSTL